MSKNKVGKGWKIGQASSPICGEKLSGAIITKFCTHVEVSYVLTCAIFCVDISSLIDSVGGGGGLKMRGSHLSFVFRPYNCRDSNANTWIRWSAWRSCILEVGSMGLPTWYVWRQRISVFRFPLYPLCTILHFDRTSSFPIYSLCNLCLQSNRSNGLKVTQFFFNFLIFVHNRGVFSKLSWFYCFTCRPYKRQALPSYYAKLRYHHIQTRRMWSCPHWTFNVGYSTKHTTLAVYLWRSSRPYSRKEWQQGLVFQRFPGSLSLKSH